MNDLIESPTELDELLCFDLYAASRAITAAYRPVLAEMGVTYPQYLVLAVLWKRGECPIKHLATTLRLDHATLTPLLRRMEDAGLLVRTRSADDERTVLVSLTVAGSALQRHEADVQCRITEVFGLDVERVEQLRTLLRQVTASASA